MSAESIKSSNVSSNVLQDPSFSENQPRTKPFLKWAGGKLRLAKVIAKHLNLPIGVTYYEPFVGAGSIFFALRPERAVLSDTNEWLIGTYRSVRQFPGITNIYLGRHQRLHSKDYYYQQREAFNNAKKISAAQGSRFIYLNSAGFNGIYRVNKDGKYNVPFGSRTEVSSPTPSMIICAANALSRTSLMSVDFETCVSTAKKGDVIYLDPPYPPLSESAYFTHYTKERFNADDQHRVAKVAGDLRDRGCRVVISNADTPFIRTLFANWTLESISQTRWVTAAATKHAVSELLITSD